MPLFGWLFRPFNRFFACASSGYVGSVARVLRAELDRAVRLRRPAAADLVRLCTHAHRLRAAAGQAISGGLRAAARRRDARSHRGGDPPHEPPSRWQPRAWNRVPAFPGLSINGFTNAPNAGIAFTPLKPFEERRDASRSRPARSPPRCARNTRKIQDAYIAVFPPPPVQGLGTIGGFKLQVEDRGDLGPDELYRQTQNLIAKAKQRPGTGRRVLRLPGQRAAGAGGHRSGEGQGGGRGAAGPVRHHAGVPRRAVRQ